MGKRSIGDRGDKGGVTPAQRVFIRTLGEQIGWSEPHLLGLARKMYHVRTLGDLNRRQAAGLIEALKAMSMRRAA